MSDEMMMMAVKQRGCMVCVCVAQGRPEDLMGSFPTHSETDSFAFDGNDWVLGCHSVLFGVHTHRHKDTQTHKA